MKRLQFHLLLFLVALVTVLLVRAHRAPQDGVEGEGRPPSSSAIARSPQEVPVSDLLGPVVNPIN